MSNWIRRGATALVALMGVLGLLLLWGQVDSLEAQVRGLTQAQMDNRLGTVSLDYFNPEIAGNKGTSMNIGLVKAKAPATEFWTGSFGAEVNKTTRIGGPLRRPDVWPDDVNMSGLLQPNKDNMAEIGTAQLRFTDVHAVEGRFFCPGGPVNVAGNTLCVDTDDLRGPTLKVLLGGQTYDVAVTLTP